ncbi:nuclear transport factor 2 family protein [Antarcticibacterium sp. 1MA-6-2]|uniref:nuclear transport factor 2 family protein n=1 Tax=Antarcticibacterium sp. 1MA-6-2 TaxID=2908210 RepID=UPI001F346E43|nr:nuclear transport factor 2 family protein [Antarcticibacterium sp. 1MA-6-2]UJH92795.1 nuclear transport factor 2 family protein [Antarcticibacterium sp. 1MA-6-2]
MKTTLQLFFLMLLSVPVVAQNSVEDEEQQIKDLITNYFNDIFSKNEQDKLSDYQTEDYLLLENGEVWDTEIIKGYMEKAAARERSPERINTFKFIEVKVSGDLAWAAYHNNAVFKRDGEKLGEMNWLESATAIRTKDGWKLQMLHSTIVKKEE